MAQGTGGLPALIETMRVLRGTLPFLDRHVARINAACRALDLLAPPRDLAQEAASHGMRPPADRVVRIRWNGASLLWDDRDLPAPGSVSVAVVSQAHPGYPHKTDQRAVFDRAVEEAAEKGAAEPLLLTVGGRVAESAHFAVAWLENGALLVPALELEILPSIGRERLVELADEQGLEVMPGRYPVDVLKGTPLILVNAVRGIVPVSRFNGSPVPSDIRLETLAEAFWPSA